jgi:hypothetical protein
MSAPTPEDLKSMDECTMLQPETRPMMIEPSCLQFLVERIAELEAKISRMKKSNADPFINCSYCGSFICNESEFADKVPAHMYLCKKNPVNVLRREYETLQEKYDALEAENARLKAPVSDEEKKDHKTWDGADTLMFEELIAARAQGREAKNDHE